MTGQQLEQARLVGGTIDGRAGRRVDEQEPALVAGWCLGGVADRRHAGVDGRVVGHDPLVDQLAELTGLVVREPDGVVGLPRRGAADAGQDHEAGQGSPGAARAGQCVAVREEVAVEVLRVDVGDDHLGAVPRAVRRHDRVDAVARRLDALHLAPWRQLHARPPRPPGRGRRAAPPSLLPGTRRPAVPRPQGCRPGWPAPGRARSPSRWRSARPTARGGDRRSSAGRPVQGAYRVDGGEVRGVSASGAAGRAARSSVRPGTCARLTAQMRSPRA